MTEPVEPGRQTGPFRGHHRYLRAGGHVAVKLRDHRRRAVVEAEDQGALGRPLARKWLADRADIGLGPGVLG